MLAKDNTLTIQVGANDGETIDIDLKQINSQTPGAGFSERAEKPMMWKVKV
ncbi:Phase 1-I flagellin [Citrobacter freundii]|nr:Phase 1-I flagellin [Citrobacter freundii]